jgi:hypothetical protein
MVLTPMAPASFTGIGRREAYLHLWGAWREMPLACRPPFGGVRIFHYLGWWEYSCYLLKLREVWEVQIALGESGAFFAREGTQGRENLLRP